LNNLVSDLQDGGFSQAVNLLGQVAGFSFPVFRNFLFGDSQNINDLINGLTQDTGNNFVFGGEGNDILLGGSGVDVINGNNNDDRIFGGQDEDILNGNNDNDTIFGGQQRDVINGGNGDNFLSGDLGEDTLTGGGGSDRFLLRNVSGPDIITDFEDGVDSLVLPTSEFPVQPNGVTFEDLTITQAEGGTVISVNGNTMAGLTGVDASNITEDDFQQISSL
jgi:Ca2+-binding RTX toxin-like protein